MADIYIATPTQADYDALMRLAESAGYVWSSNEKPTQFNAWPRLEGGTVINLVGNKVYYEPLEYLSSENCTIEKISNLAGIKAIWNVKPEYLDVFSDEKFNTSDIIKDWALNDGVIILLKNGSYDLGFEEVYKALAVEYKPKESEEAMNAKMKLPKFVCDWLKGFEKDYPLNVITKVNRLRNLEYNEVSHWLSADVDNQWELIDALRYGYEAEAEQLYYVWLIKGDKQSFLNVSNFDTMAFSRYDQGENGYQTKFTMDEIIAIDPRYKAFAVPVEEVDGNGK